jgi:hypothetical protein
VGTGLLDVGVGILRGTLLALDGAVALTAIPGGVALAVGAEDQRYPTAWLRRTPFRTYRVPGALLSELVRGSAPRTPARGPGYPRSLGPDG